MRCITYDIIVYMSELAIAWVLAPEMVVEPSCAVGDPRVSAAPSTAPHVAVRHAQLRL